MVKNIKVCKECGLIVDKEVKKCPNEENSIFVEKYKGTTVILNAKESMVAEKLNIKNNGIYALKY